MKTLLLAITAGLLLTGCETQYGWGGKSAGTPAKAAKPAAQQPPGSTPVQSANGKIASVRADLKFVVVDFSPGGLPPVGKRMAVYRDGQKVGEVTISGPVIDSNIAADIVAGKIQAGDVVRDE
ncbi:MAG: hypothetical protein HY301_13155 [Verrucomicrobia bacterium]|nr:hypothetical protein [Verrucomicrobiota bacterium]